MKVRFLMMVVLALCIGPVLAQKTNELYMPREYKQAYENETRTHEGRAGKNYFQNKTDYVIKAEFFPDTKLLVGSEIIRYYNNSPDTLSWIYMNLFQNLYKKGEARDSYLDANSIHDGVQIKSIKVNGMEIELESMTYYSTILVFPVPDKVHPASETKIEVEWQQLMPLSAMRRIGTYDESSFCVGYWYPKMSVYDDIVGWNTFGHTGNAEFYSDYGGFDVEITVPAEYNVWSSGVLQNTKEIFRDKYIQRIEEASKSDEVIHIIDENDRDENKITLAGKKHIWRFKASNLPDFAFIVSNKYLWDATSAKVGDSRVLVNSVYNKNSENFRKVTEISKKSIEYYSNIVPAILYPYPLFTAFNGEAKGMEFPAMINDREEDEFSTLFTTTHEIAHTYFPFYVGTNEQEYGWMDEGLVSIIGISALVEFMESDEASIFPLVNKKYHAESAKLAIDIPLMTGTHSAGDFTSGFMTYVRPITAFSLLFDYMGKDKFYQAIREFTEQWKDKHPIPYDMFYAFNKVANEDLGWFWEPWFFDLGYADIGIGRIDYGTDEITINVENLGSFPIPVHMLVNYKNGESFSVNKRMDIWKSGIKSCQILVPKGEIAEIVLDTNTPEAYYVNNILSY
ncbi:MULTISPECIES: M1 family metallopeptidase [unclassified Lentimicrobium]|uniref:M1 family metallopeptidase n=1 Tax=unclassified Lentimicrobium TaxID=2677434 RepID=UPI0015539E91|nr:MULTISPECIES: M1 family metallopeptidase [unclassified Lentimicrobium]NPD45386.1 M1 family metallopeptidase [Lentimicrobium sp. S6]NPD85247.1 M1 family metallopeptidase [Lentimicrobium sp. L6]